MQIHNKPVIWHPFADYNLPPIHIKSARGSYIYDRNDKPYLDLISSWWVNLHGHAEPNIAAAIYKQSLELEHVIFSGFTHEPADNLCKNLYNILPPDLSHFFFSDNGSTSVEVGLKMAYQYHHNRGDIARTLFLSFEGGYHGDTFGAMAVGQKSGFHNVFQDLLLKVLSIPYPATWDDDHDITSKINYALLALDNHLEKYGNQIAAIIMEPLIQGASGMRMAPKNFITQVIERVRTHNILVIFDEVMTGFGRTGTNFALDQLDDAPDFLCLSKGITGGFLPLALTVTSDKIYSSFKGNKKGGYTFAHGHSYTANPLACAAAICSLNLLLKPETINKLLEINKTHKEGINYLKQSCSHIIQHRILGTISAFEVNNSHNFNAIMKEQFLENGLLIRPLGNTIYLLPPYSITLSELLITYEKIGEIINLII